MLDGGEVDCSIHAVGELWIAAQEWPPSETGDGLVQIDSVKTAFDDHLQLVGEWVSKMYMFHFFV